MSEHKHRKKGGGTRICILDFAHLVGASSPLTWCRHGQMDPNVDAGYCVHSGTVAPGDRTFLRIGTPCDDPFLVGE